MTNDNGKTTWIFPDLEMPPKGDSALIGHESVIILNTNDTDATVTITLYFSDREPIENIRCTVPARRVKCLRTYIRTTLGVWSLRRKHNMPCACKATFRW